jgi:hypothetical protein
MGSQNADQCFNACCDRWYSRGDMPVISLKTERKDALEEKPDSKPMGMI